MTTLGSQGPIEPSAVQREASREMRALFAALVAEGFTESQALTLIGHLLKMHGQGGAA